MKLPLLSQIERLKTGTIVDKLYELRAHRLAEQRKVDKIKTREAEITAVVRDRLLKERQTRVAGKVGQISVKPELVAKVTDWGAFFSAIAKHDAWEVLTHRVNHGAYRELLENGTVLAGAESEPVIKVNLTKKGN